MIWKKHGNLTNWEMVILITVFIIGLIVSMIFEEKSFSCLLIGIFSSSIIISLMYLIISGLLKPYTDFGHKQKEYDLKIAYEEKMIELSKKHQENVEFNLLLEKVNKLEERLDNLN